MVITVRRGRIAGAPLPDAAANLALRVPRGSSGPIPMVVVMGNAPASTLDVLTALPTDIQVIVVGEGTGVDDWVAAVGPEIAASVDVAALV